MKSIEEEEDDNDEKVVASEPEEDEDEEDDFADAVADEPVKKKKRTAPPVSNVSRFFDDMASEDDADDEDEEGGTNLVEAKAAAEFSEELERQNARRNKVLIGAESDDLEGIVEGIKERHGAASKRRGERIAATTAAGGALARKSKGPPSLTDPRLWMVAVKPGREKEAALSLMNKLSATGDNSSISGVVWTGLKSLVYIESRSESAAKEAIAGLTLYKPYTMKMCPVGDMVAVLESFGGSASSAGEKKQRRRRRKIQENDWVRLARGEYRGDVARVVAVSDDASSAVLQIVPRSEGGVRRLFSPAEVLLPGAVEQRRFPTSSNGRGAAERWRDVDDYFDVYQNNWYKGGFLYKEVRVATMLSQDQTKPTLDELEKFATSDNPLEKQIADMVAGDTTTTKAIAAGDSVEVVRGDLKGLVLKVERVSAGIVFCRHKDLTVQIDALDVEKRIAVGSRVKMFDGRYSGSTGVVLEAGDLQGDKVAVVLTDGGREITVRVAHAHESKEIARGLDSLAGYELHDLVQLPVGAVGLVTRVNQDNLELLDAHGDKRTVRPNEVQRKLNLESTRNVTLDARDEHVREKDVVELVAKPSASDDYNGNSATVLRAYRASLWVLFPNNAIKVIKARKAKVAGAQVSANGLADAYMGLGRRRNVTEGSFNDKAASGSFSSSVQKKDPLLGRLVRICKGNYKGLAGMVKNATATHVTVELQTRAKIVTEPRDRVKQVSEAQQPSFRAAEISSISHENEMNTPYLTGETPMLHGGATPGYGANTPGRATTPGGGFGAATPGRYTPAHTPGIHGTPGRVGTPGQTAGLSSVWLPKSIGVQDFGDDEDNNSVASDTAQRTEVVGKKGDAWLMPGVLAISNGAQCRIDAVLSAGTICQITLLSDDFEQKKVPAHTLERVTPQPNDQIRVNDAGSQYDAKLLELEGSDGIIKVESGEYKIIDFSAIAKIAPKF